MRLFVAVFPPEEDRAHLRQRLTAASCPGPEPTAGPDRKPAGGSAGGAVAGAGGGPGGRRRRAAFRLTPVERWHVTLAFLGEVPATRLPDVEQAVASVRRREPIPLRIAGGGSFGGRGRSSVLWAGLDGDVPALVSMQANLRAALEAAGLPHDERPFTPHLTVAYAHSEPVRAALDAYTGSLWRADELVLVRSRPPEGYTRLHTWPITNTP